MRTHIKEPEPRFCGARDGAIFFFIFCSSLVFVRSMHIGAMVLQPTGFRAGINARTTNKRTRCAENPANERARKQPGTGRDRVTTTLQRAFPSRAESGVQVFGVAI